MSQIKSKGNVSTELLLIKLFKKSGIKGWRRNQKIFGKPDFIFVKYKVAEFADGCFWHSHNCKNIAPKTNAKFWHTKLEKNIKRDKLVNHELKKEGWKVIRIWECNIKKSILPKQLINLLTTENRLRNR